MAQQSRFFDFMQRRLMKPMGKIANLRVVRAVMEAGMATIPFTIVGSMFLVLNVIPQAFPIFKGIWSVSFDKIQSLYMIANTSTMGILALYFGLVFGYEYTRIHRDEEHLELSPLNGALLSMFAFFMCLPELVVKGGTFTLLNLHTKNAIVVNGYRMDTIIQRLGTSGIFTAIIMSILAVKLYYVCVKKHWTIKMPSSVPSGVSRSFTALIPTAVISFAVLTINGILNLLGTDIFKMVSIPFGFVTHIANTWAGLMVIYFLISALWIVGIHGANIITSFLTPIVLSNMEANIHGANFPLTGEFNNSFVTIGGSGATLGLVFLMAFLARSAQLKSLGKMALVPALFNINEPIIFGAPIVYNPYLAVPFFVAPMVSASIGYFAIKTHFVHAIIAQVPWPSPVGIGAFIGSGGSFTGAIVAVIDAIVATLIWFPFFKVYDNSLVKEEMKNSNND